VFRHASAEKGCTAWRWERDVAVMARLQCSRQSARAKKEHLRIRRQLMALVREHAERENLEHYHVSRACGFSQPRSWNLLHGPLKLWNSETLINVLARFGYSLELTVTERRRVNHWKTYAKYEAEGADLFSSKRGV
jgi:predicted XRE-type DNA-binding protein